MLKFFVGLIDNNIKEINMRFINIALLVFLVLQIGGREYRSAYKTMGECTDRLKSIGHINGALMYCEVEYYGR